MPVATAVTVSDQRGDHPSKVPEAIKRSYQFKSSIQCDLTRCTRDQIKEYFVNTYDLDEFLFTGLVEESSFVKCPDRLRLPLIFYFAHTASVYINKLMLAGLIKERVNKDFEITFETGVDEMSWDDTENYRMGGSFQWPSVQEVLKYRDEVRQVILDLINSMPLQLPVTPADALWSIFMGFEHERIHLETSSVLLRQLPVGMLKRPVNWKYGPTAMDVPAGPNEFVKVPAGKVIVGKPTSFPSYGWDNEYGRAEIDVPEFEATKYLVTNRDFLEFVKDGGYERRDLWTDEGWKWVEFRQACHPTFWVCEEGCMSGCGADLASYSHCSCAPSGINGVVNGEGSTRNGDANGMGIARNGGANGVASARNGGANGVASARNGDANGMGIARNGDANGVASARNGGANGVANGGANGVASASNGGAKNGLESRFRYRAIYDVMDMPWDWPVDANYHEGKAFCTWKGEGLRVPTEAEHHRMRGDLPPCSDSSCDPAFNPDYPANINLKYGSSTPVNMFPPSPMGFYDIYGNVWEWTEDHFNGLPGFKTTYLYDDFSTPCFDGRHTMMMGGSWMSTGAESSRFARFAFRRHFFQHLGFRMVRSSNATPAKFCKAEVFVLGAGVTDNPITTPDVVKEKCFRDSTNTQFQYETKQELDSQLGMEYGNAKRRGMLMASLVETVLARHGVGNANALLLGCGGGHTSFLLTKIAEKVVAVDYSGRFIDAALTIQSGKEVEFGDGQVARLPDSEGVDGARVIFKQMTWVPNELEGYNLILIEFLDRLSEPKGWLIKLWECLVPRAIVVIASDSGKWNRCCLQGHIGKWFDFLEDAAVGDRHATVWRLK